MLRRGITLIETVLFIGLIAIILPGLFFFVIHLIERQDHISTQLLVRQSAALSLQEFQQEIQNAQAISISSSTLSSSTSSLTYVNGEGVTKTIRYAADTFSASGTTRQIGRLQLSFQNQQEWLTTSDLTVETFRIDPVRNADGDLTALNVLFVLSPHLLETSSQQAERLTLETTFWLSPYVSEQ